jgi:hypothetical protein
MPVPGENLAKLFPSQSDRRTYRPMKGGDDDVADIDEGVLYILEIDEERCNQSVSSIGVLLTEYILWDFVFIELIAVRRN